MMGFSSGTFKDCLRAPCIQAHAFPYVSGHILVYLFTDVSIYIKVWTYV